MGKKLALIFLTASSPVALACLLVDAPAAPALFAAVSALFPAALMAVGAADRDGRLGRAAPPILVLTGLLLLVMWGLFQFRDAGTDVPWWGGLPAGAAVQLYGLFILPFCVTSLGYAWAFEQGGLRQEDLDSLRRRFPGSHDLECDRLDGDRLDGDGPDGDRLDGDGLDGDGPMGDPEKDQDLGEAPR